MKEELQPLEKSNVTTRSRFKIPFLIASMLTFFVVLIDNIFADAFMQSSIQLTLWMQKVNLKIFSWSFSTVVFSSMFLYVFFMYTIRQDIVKNLILVTGICLMVYFQAILKLVFVDWRPVFLNAELNDDFCICDYGKPSGHVLITSGLALLIWDDLKLNYNFSKLTEGFLKALTFLVVVMMGLSRIYMGAHSYNQVIIGIMFGVTLFFLIRRTEDSISKFIIDPIVFKERSKNKKAVFYILSILLLMNYGLLYMWSQQSSRFENITNPFFRFSNCFSCFNEFTLNFSTKVVKESMIFNIIFGMLLGIYLMPGEHYNFKGLYFDQSIKFYLFRLAFMLIFLSPLVLIYVPKVKSESLALIKAVVLPIIVGYLITNPYVFFMNKVDAEFSAPDEKENPSDLSSIINQTIYEDDLYDEEMKTSRAIKDGDEIKSAKSKIDRDMDELSI